MSARVELAYALHFLQRFAEILIPSQKKRKVILCLRITFSFFGCKNSVAKLTTVVATMISLVQWLEGCFVA